MTITRWWGDRRLRLVAVAVLLVILVGVGFVLVTQRSWGQSTVARKLGHAVDRLATAPSLHTTIRLKIDLPKASGPSRRAVQNFDVRLSGDLRRAADQTPELAADFKIEATGRGNIFFADGQAFILRDEVVFYLNNLPQLFNPSGSLVERWTSVKVPVLETRNPADIRQMLTAMGSIFSDQGIERLAGERMHHLVGQPTVEQAAAFHEVIRQRSSGNRAWHVLARLLAANDVAAADLWVTPAGELRQVQLTFVEPALAGVEPRHFATLTMTFSDYEQAVDFGEIPRGDNVDPAVFAALFGSGELPEVK